ncbi:MAG: CocE/NonD family hydrolase [Pseudomonadota bacterium]
MAGTAENPIEYPPLEMPANVERETVTVWSLGLALDADVFRPRDAGGTLLPAVVLSHGIGGDKLTAERYAANFAAAGIIAISFSQPSWGNSQGRLTITDPAAKPDAQGNLQVNARMAKDLIDPLEWVDAYRSALDFIEGDRRVDTNRLGAWGTSFGGGTAFYTTGIDQRIRALAIQVPAVFNPPPPMQQLGRLRATQIARGETSPFPDGPQDALPNVPGVAHYARIAQFRVADQADNINVPTLIIDAGNEELFDIRESGGKAYARLQERGIESHYEVIPGIDHYGIYFDGYTRSSALALDWFQRHI